MLPTMSLKSSSERLSSMAARIVAKLDPRHGVPGYLYDDGTIRIRTSEVRSICMSVISQDEQGKRRAKRKGRK